MFTFLIMIAAVLCIVFLCFSKGVTASFMGKTRGKRFYGGVLAIFICGFIFWDAIPTWYTHYQLCKNEAGLKYYETPDEWRERNGQLFLHIKNQANGEFRKKRMVRLTENEEITYDEPVEGFIIESKIYLRNNYGFNTRRIFNRLIYAPEGKVMLEYTDFYGGSGEASMATGANTFDDYKFWTITGACATAYPSMEGKFKIQGKTFDDFINQILDWKNK